MPISGRSVFRNSTIDSKPMHCFMSSLWLPSNTNAIFSTTSLPWRNIRSDTDTRYAGKNQNTDLILCCLMLLSHEQMQKSSINGKIYKLRFIHLTLPITFTAALCGATRFTNLKWKFSKNKMSAVEFGP